MVLDILYTLFNQVNVLVCLVLDLGFMYEYTNIHLRQYIYIISGMDEYCLFIRTDAYMHGVTWVSSSLSVSYISTIVYIVISNVQQTDVGIVSWINLWPIDPSILFYKDVCYCLEALHVPGITSIELPLVYSIRLVGLPEWVFRGIEIIVQYSIF